jgi:ketosteroid isomerase-like protein
MLNRYGVLAGVLCLSLSSAVFAAAGGEAQGHFKAIAAGQVDQIMHGYADDAHFEWVGGPLNGSYAGTEKIREVWMKFAKANAPLSVSVKNLEENANPAGETVTANVEFKGKNVIKVRYVLTYRGGKLVNEIWQIDPKLSAY